MLIDIVKINKIERLIIKKLTQDATFRTKSCTMTFEEICEFTKNDFEEYEDNENH